MREDHTNTPHPTPTPCTSKKPLSSRCRRIALMILLRALKVLRASSDTIRSR